MIVVFTGHRDRGTSEEALTALVGQFPSATWMHGGARGFDRQVGAFATTHGIAQEVVSPDYSRYPGRVAPLIRNRQMIDQADLVVACYDGRESGGTYQAITYARKCGKPVQLLPVQTPAP